MEEEKRARLAPLRLEENRKAEGKRKDSLSASGRRMDLDDMTKEKHGEILRSILKEKERISYKHRCFPHVQVRIFQARGHRGDSAGVPFPCDLT